MLKSVADGGEPNQLKVRDRQPRLNANLPGKASQVSDVTMAGSRGAFHWP
ncbi:hypothetical protein CKA32_006391 [Geitlerinema sp. FC II]|nr:hypothetical protein CKA32_000727 [Geitlerinema sp. FC II]PPT06648.1 hypothetical protein CKA32_005253 [Geitlerinema sp. FC II]PPT08613.1 hypothetical protein CKA32_006391 [Geitlerinema sp. FC II]